MGRGEMKEGTFQEHGVFLNSWINGANVAWQKMETLKKAKSKTQPNNNKKTTDQAGW